MTNTLNINSTPSQITWKKGLFRCVYQLQSAGKNIGRLKPSWKSLSATAMLDDSQYRFSVSELKGHTLVIDQSSGETVARIKFGHWLPKATIHYQGKIYQWSLSNLWETRWKISGENGTLFRYKGWSCRGSVDASASIDLLTLTGLFISHYYWQMTTIYVAVFLPILMAAV